MTEYLIKSRVHPNAYHGSLLTGASAIVEVIAEANEAVTVLEWIQHLEGGEQIALRLRGTERDQAFNEVLSLVQGFGYSLVDAEVGEIVDRTVQGAVLGLVACGGIGSTTKAPAITTIAALAGALAGAKAGSMVEKIGVRHRYQWFPARGWVVTALGSDAPPASPGLAPVLFPA